MAVGRLANLFFYCWHACPVWRKMGRPRTIQEMIIVNGETNDLQ
jgi:hypothetical protein